MSRTEWGARPPKQSQEIPPTNMTFLHHSAGQECAEKARCEEIVRGIQKFHMDDRGGLNKAIGLEMKFTLGF